MSFHHFDPPTPTGSPPLSSSSLNSDTSLRSLTAGLKRSHGPKPRFLRRCDTICCATITYFPLLIVYGATSWAVWVEAWSISLMSIGGTKGTLLAAIGTWLYVMLIWSYTVATFSSPGTPLNSKHSYSHLPTSDIASNTVTVKASGEERFCKKCQCRKPDRAHHCSSCNTCVLKMDHHCPWLANCIGLHNYKCFVLFTVYLSIFCVFACAVSTVYLWDVFFVESSYIESFMPINWVLLSIISGIVGLVISGFSGWHLMLVLKAETTIESLEKTRYLSPLRRPMIPPGAHMFGEGPGENQALGPEALANRERERYNAYIIEETSRQMPNAFDLGWKNNFIQVFGEKWILWGIPLRNSVGDGWTWQTSERWKQAQRNLVEKKQQEALMEQERSRRGGWGGSDTYAPSGLMQTPSWPRPKIVRSPSSSKGGTSKASRILGAAEEEFTHGLGGSRYSPSVAAASGELANAVRMQDLKKKPMSRVELSEDEEEDDYESSSDETGIDERRKLSPNAKAESRPRGTGNDEDWAAGW